MLSVVLLISFFPSLLLYSSSGQFFKKQESQAAAVIVLDPGVRTFQTCYDASRLIVECEKYDIGRIYRFSN
jgi:hypothetical protein